MTDRLARTYYTLGTEAALSTVDKIAASARPRASRPSKAHVRSWLETQATYTRHRPICKRIPRNPYMTCNIMDLWQADLLDLQNISHFNDNFRYILTVIDVFSKYLHLIPLKAKTGSAVAKAFGSILNDPKYLKPYVRRPVVIQTDRGKEFLNKPFRDLLRREGIEHRTCRNPDVKCSVAERVQRTIREKLNKFFTYKNSYRYIDVLQKFAVAYNKTVHSTTGMAPVEINDSNVLDIWNRMEERRRRIRTVAPKYKVGQHVRISKEKFRFSKGAEPNFSEEVFIITKVIKRRPRPVYELQDLNTAIIDGQFYQEELTPVRISARTVFKIDKILCRRTRNGIREVLVHWKGYPKSFDSWIPASSVKSI